MGPKIFPALAKHFWDDRYSYSDMVVAWHNYTVGEVVLEIFSDGNPVYGGYKGRKTPSGEAVYPSFREYLKAQGFVEDWAEKAKTKSPSEIQVDYIDWCVAAEKKRGFTDPVQKKEILGRYFEKRNFFDPGHSGGAANRSQPARAQTNQTSAGAGSAR
ncbi:MAG TPA: hypothetical protein VJA21_03365 [Verrucomicrobiae bacterium]